MNSSARDAVLSEFCKSLKLPGVLREYEALCRRAKESGLEYEEFLHQLLEIEIRNRQDSAAKQRFKDAHFPDQKTLSQIDWEELKGVSRPKIVELSSCEYLARAQDVIIAGPIGTGKTHLAIALGIEATQRRQRVLFIRAAELVRTLIEARDAKSLGRLHKKYQQVTLLIIDELGFVPFERAGGELLFNLLSERYERRSTMVTTNLSFKEWAKIFGDEKLTLALLDRLGHHASVLTTKGESYRMNKGKKEKA